MFTPKWSSPSMLQMTPSTRAHTSPAYCSLPRKDSLLLQACGKQQAGLTSPRLNHLACLHLERQHWATCLRPHGSKDCWDTGLSSLLACVDSSLQPGGTSRGQWLWTEANGHSSHVDG